MAARYRGADRSLPPGAERGQDRPRIQVTRSITEEVNRFWSAWMLYTCRLRAPFRRGPLVLLLLALFILSIFYTFSRFQSDHRKSLKARVKEYEAIDEKKDIIYGIVFDAGSTGSRIHIFRFLRHAHVEGGQEKFQLLSDDFHHTKPGLSSFAYDPSQAPVSLEPLMEKAKELIPKRRWANTVTVLYATAGLRLIPEKKSKAILNNVREYLVKSGLRIPDPDAVSIMDGATEGIMSWVTLNYMLRRLAYPSSTYGALDLGGGSTQITFLPANSETHAAAPNRFITSYNIGSRAFDFYTNSYLGLGLMSARHQMMGGLEGKPLPSSEENKLSSPCLPPSFKGSWRHGGFNYSIETSGLNGYQACIQSATSLVKELYHVDSQREFLDRSFFAFSYFYDRAVDAKLIKKRSPGRVMRVGEFLSAADRECSSNTAKRPFLCMDLCYISALLTHGYGFQESSKIHVMKKVNGVELSWCLGTMVNLLYKQ